LNFRKKQLVLDTTICIDLFNGRILEKVKDLPYESTVPDVIAEELINPPGDHLIKAGFSTLGIQGEVVEQINALRKRYPNPSTNDLFSLMLAKVHSSILVTGDDALRKAARNEKIPVHGVLWILDKMVLHRVLKPRQAAEALENMLAEGSWLPKYECELRLKKWKR
jgi:predicted nucleic acid-binding protein